MKNSAHRWQMVKIDSNRLIQGYIETTDIDFKLRGYTLGSDPSYFANPPDMTPSVTQEETWAAVDVSAYVDGSADGVILFIDNTDAGAEKYAIREVGSTL